MAKLQHMLGYAARDRQSQPLLQDNAVQEYGSIPEIQLSTPAGGKKTIGFWSSVFIIFNRMIGTGILANPATVLALSGSVGLSIALWLFGILISAAGMQVYIVWGCALPKNGAETNYLQYLFPRPAYLVLCLYAASSSFIGALLSVVDKARHILNESIGWAAANALVTAEYFLKAILGETPSGHSVQLVSLAIITITLLLHGVFLEWGLRVQNMVGVFKLLILAAIAVTGLVALKNGIPASDSWKEIKPSRWRGLDNFANIWDGTILNPSSICLALNSVIWSFHGFSNANYAMAEMEDPERMIKIVGPSAIAVVAASCLISIVSYLLGASKEEIITSGRLLVALLMNNIWGERTERFVDMAVALSNFGSVLAICFAQGWINQELAKEGVLPLSTILASSEPFNAPLAAFGLNWFCCVLIIVFVPSGDIYNLIVNVAVYPFAVVWAVIAFGLIYLSFRCSPGSDSEENNQYDWHLSPGTLIATVFFGAVSVFLMIAPFIPPPPGVEPYQTLPYWTHAVVSWALFAVGAIWWAIVFRGQEASTKL